jgi:signal transduction histidine kinase/PAS domain-containing protein
MRGVRQVLALLLLFILAPVLSAETVLKLQDDQQAVSVGRFLSVVRLTSQETALPSEAWAGALQPNQKELYDGGFGPGTDWVRLILRNDSNRYQTILLENRDVFVPTVRLWSQGDKLAPLASFHYSTSEGQNRFVLPYSYPVYKIEVPPGTHPFWFELRGIPKRLKLYLWDESSFVASGYLEFLLLIALMMIPLSVMMYQLCSYVMHRDPLDLSYILFLLSVWSMGMVHQGFVGMVLPAFVLEWMYTKGIYSIYILIGFTALKFCENYFEPRLSDRGGKGLKLWYRLLLAGVVATWLLPFGSYFLLFTLATLLSGIVALYFLVGAVKSSKDLAVFVLVGALPMIAQLFYYAAGAFSQTLTFSSIEVWTPVSLSVLAISLSLGVGKRRQKREEQASREIAQLNSELQLHIANVQSLVDQKTSKIRSIMENIKQGIFVINRDGLIDAEFSSYMAEIFPDIDVSHENPMKLLFERSNLSADECAQLDTFLQVCLGEDMVSFLMNQAILPREVRNHNMRGEEKLLECDFIPIPDAAGMVERILVSVRDVTLHRELQQQNVKHTQKIRIIDELLKEDPLKIKRFLDQGQNYLELCKLAFDAAHNERMQQEMVHEVLINMHTMKGISRSQNLRIMSHSIHELEAALVEMKETQQFAKMSELAARFVRLMSLFENYRETAEQMFGRDWESAPSFAFRSQMMEALGYFYHLSAPTVLAQRKYFLRLKNILEKNALVTTEGLIAEIRDGIRHLAHDLGKVEPNLKLKIDDSYLSPQQDLGLRNVFLHLVRNAMDHGIEPPELREARGKSAAGVLTLSIQREQHSIVIEFSDDGQGLQLDKIRQRAVAMGIIDDQSELPVKELVDLIFEPGFSTAGAVSEISGRGIGMDAVKKMVQDMGGKSSIILETSEPKNALCFVFRIELPEFQLRQEAA